MKSIFTSLLPLILAWPYMGQAQNWANRIGTTNYATTVDKIRPLNGQQILVSGTFAAPSLSLGNAILSNRGQEDGYLAIANLDGTYHWALAIGGSGKDQCIDVATNQQGRFSVIGNFKSNALNIGNIALNNSGETDVFIAHFDADKNLLWAKTIGSSDVEEAVSIAVDQIGNTYVAGNVYNKLTLQLIRVFVRKLDPSGNLLWEKIGSIQGGFLSGTAIAVDDQQHLYFAGSVSGTAQFDQTSITSDQDYSAFLIKYQPDGRMLVVKTMDDLEKFNALQFKNQRLYGAAQKFNWSFGWGWPLADSKIHTLCFSSDLDLVWHKNAGGLVPSQSLDIAKSISIDENENVYVAGYFFSDTLRFAGQAHANLFHIHYYYPQIFLLKYSNTGEEKWIKTFGGLLSDEATNILAYKNDNLVIAGNFESESLQWNQLTLKNDNEIDSMYVHLKPKRFFRKSMGYLAYFNNQVNSAPSLKEQATLDVWPNPVDEKIQIQYHGPIQKSIWLQFLNIEGKVIRSVVHNSSDSGIQEDISGFPAGTYILQVHLGDQTLSKTIVKSNK